ncbi:protein RTF2-like [Melia azedarach]|uniref:Protein RTF2-like n=1 Tax=Melia azedarach TaxID=155640 RepID=A0ACC1XFL5_MELAZ|nr:protein RTF2-like [Melia azedarach]
MPAKTQIFIKSPTNSLKTLALDPTQSKTLTLNQLKSSLLSLDQPLSSFYFTLNGKILDDSTQLSNNHRIPPFSTLYLRQRVFGGGGDGGATGAESRDCYLNMYAEKKPDKIDPNEQRLSKWCNCALSNEPLKEPCVIDKLGNIFNKEALVHALLSKNLPKGFSYIKGLKDMINVKLSRVPGVEENGDSVRFQCPIAGLEFNGKYKFLALRTCGHVLSVKALKEVKTSSCLVCHKEFSELDKIVINGKEEEVAVLLERMEEEKAKIKEKKVKKGKNGEVGMGKEDALDSSRVSGTKRGAVENKGLEKALAKVEGNGKVENVKVLNGNVPVKRFKAADMAPANANKEVYASIFTSSKKSNFKETYACRSLPLGRN